MKYTKITISGKICTGKSTLFKNLAKKLHWQTFHTGQFFRNYVKKHRLDLERAEEQNESLTKKIDYKVRDMLRKEKKFYIFDGWMTGIMADNYSQVLRILLACDDHVRAERFAKREKIPLKKAKQLIKERETNLFEKLREIYRRDDFVEPKNYNCVIDTTKLSSADVFKKVMRVLKTV
jgi:predicted cytidylate kinase